MFKHLKTGIIFSNRKDAIIVLGTARYRKALANREFEFSYQLKGDEKPIVVEYNH